MKILLGTTNPSKAQWFETSRKDFELVERIDPNRHPGWSLDSISVEPDTGLYFADDSPRPPKLAGKTDDRACLIAFLTESFALERRKNAS